MKIREDIKTELRDLKRSAADLSREIDINYEILNRYLNGRADMPQGVEEKIKKALDGWKV